MRLTLAGVGGAFGGREDLSMHVHACLLAMHTGKPVKMSYNREESFFGHVHRHPARLHYEHGFTRDGDLVYVRATIWLDGGAYASSSAAVVGNAGLMGIGPYVVPNVHMDCYGAYTNNPPCGAMRGFGAVQAAFAYESQMDKGAAALGIDPVELRCRNAMEEGSIAPTGQVVDSPAPVAELLRRLQAMPLPPDRVGEDLRQLPGGVANSTHGEGVRRGVGYAVAYKNIGFSEGFDDYSTARVRLEVTGGRAGGDGAHRGGRGRPGPGHRAAADRPHRAGRRAGRGRARGHRGGQRRLVVGVPADLRDRRRGARGVPAGARPGARPLRRRRPGTERRHRRRSWPRWATTRSRRPSSGGTGPPRPSTRRPGRATRTCSTRSPPTARSSTSTSSSGLVKVVEMACTQDVGKAVNPQAVVGQIHGGSAQGWGWR